MSKAFMSAVGADSTPKKDKYELLILNESGILNINIKEADTVVCPPCVTVGTPVLCKTVITCGMSPESTLSFSCIEEDRALLSLSRNVNRLQPGEVYVKYRKELSLYENLALQAVRLLNIR